MYSWRLTSPVPCALFEWETRRGRSCRLGSVRAATEAKKQSMSKWMIALGTPLPLLWGFDNTELPSPASKRQTFTKPAQHSAVSEEKADESTLVDCSTERNVLVLKHTVY